MTAVNSPDGNVWPQMLKGFPMEERPTGVAAIGENILGTTLDVESGMATMQFAIGMYDVDGELFDFTTMRTLAPVTDITTMTEDTVITFSGPLAEEQTFGTWLAFISDFAAELEPFGVQIQLLGIGFNAYAPDASTVNSISFRGDTYVFGTDCGAVEEPGTEEPDAEEPKEETPSAPTPPTKVDTAAGSADASALLTIGGLALAATSLGIAAKKRRVTNE